MARETCPLPFLLALVALPDHKLNVLQEHLAKRSHRLGVLVDVQRDEQDQLLINDIVDGQKVVIRPRDDRERVVKERHALIEQALDFRHTIAIFK